MDEIYLSGFSEGSKLYLPTVSLITVFIKEYCGTKSFVYRIVSTPSNPAVYPVAVSLESFTSTRFISIEEDDDILQNAKCWQGKRIFAGLCTILRQIFLLSSSKKSRFITMEACPESIKNCTLPALRCHHSNMVLSGLCAVLRHILKVSAIQDNIPGLLQLLGNEETCLKAGAEISLWTKLCEVDMPKAVDQILSKACTEAGDFKIPDELLRLERQFWSLRFKAHRNKQVEKASCLQDKETGVESEQPDGCFSHLKLNYVQGPQITLADIILLPCVAIILNNCKDQLSWVSEHLPHTLLWLEKLCKLSCTDAAFTSVHLPKPLLPSKDAKLPAICCNSDAVRRQPKPRKCRANPTDMEHILKKISVLNTAHLGDHLSYDVHLDWQHLPDAVLPKDGCLPQDKVKRKCQQLENLATAVMKLTKPGDVLVDFCSGCGHLGILLAYLLPNCKVVLVENKEESIQLAETKIEKLQLKNVALYQCNIVYFTGRFNIGVCLHACGSATDLVLDCCLKNNASFVICPCCYGKIQYCHTVTYPRSDMFRNTGLTHRDYLSLALGADLMHYNRQATKQGRKCMTYIDMDRAHLAIESGYAVTLTTLKPHGCSIKSNLIIGKIAS